MPKKLSSTRSVLEVISLFVGMGCELKSTGQKVEFEDGEFFLIRYLISPNKSAFVPLDFLDDSDFIFDEEIEYMERRLGVQIPKPTEIN